MSFDNSDIIEKAEAILASAKSFNGDRGERHELMKQVNLLYSDLEDPMDAIYRQFEFMNISTAVNTLARLDAFEKMPLRGSITAKELGAQINLEPGVIVRLMRMLTGTGLVALTGKDTYSHTPKSLAYRREAARDFLDLCCNMNIAYTTFPDYSSSHTPEEITDLKKTPYSCAYGSEGLMFYEVLTQKPEVLGMFNKAMTQMELSIPILGMFGFSTLKQQYEAELDRALIVDIGGGRGHCLLEIQKETRSFHPAPKMVLEDRPPVLSSIPQELLPGIEKLPYDYYTEQPIKNAHIYYLRRITHNYYDGPCLAFLGRIVKVMGPTSRLLIAEFVVPDQTEVGEDMSTYWMDLVMLAIGGKERSKKDFEQLLAKVGLEISHIWMAPKGTGSRQGVVECRKK